MLRNLVTALALAIFAQTALGLGLGSLQKSSALNEPFSARIEILSATAADFDTLTVKLADTEQFDRAGVIREAVLLGLKFRVVQERRGKDYVQISSNLPIKEPYLNFLLELNWANGRMVREYTVLLDPPLYDPVRKPMAAKTAPTPAPPEPSPTVSEPLPSPRPSPPTSAPPTAGDTAAGYSGGDTIGPVSANDTLWRLANARRPANVSVQQMMMALFLANPEAFGNDNINVLKRGAVLRMPSNDELTALSHREAVAQAQQHHQAWNNYRQGAALSAAEQPLGSDDLVADGAAAGTDSDMSIGAENDDARLELVAPDESDQTSGVGGGSGTDSSLLQEQLDAASQENAELLAKISEADEIIDLMQRQVEIKDEELAALQARLRELGVDAPPTDVDAELGDAVAEQDDVTEPADEGSVDELFEDEIAAEPAPEEGAEDTTETVAEEEEVADEPAIVESDTAASEDSAPSSGATGFLSSLVPAHIADMVPGGVMTVLGVIGALLLLVLGGIIKRLTGGREKDMPTPSHEKAKEAATAAQELDETVAEVVEDDDTTASELETDTIEAQADTVSESFEDTLEASSDELAPAVEPEADDAEDPLEEVNVYLAYERFDQAEELVRKVIADNPDEPKYRLRLLEVFYSSNDQAAYEGEARNLFDAVGEEDPMWQSALAMWGEISPDRALFAEGGVEPGVADTGSMKAFVDITSETDDGDATGGTDTVSMGPDAQANLESTAVGLMNDDEVGPVDFNLSEDDDSIEADGTVELNLATASDADLLDLTAAETEDADVADSADILDLDDDVTAADNEQILDLTGTAEAADELFDLTETSDGGTDTTADEVFDLTESTLGGVDAGDMLDLTSTTGTDDDVLDLTAATDDELGDVTGDDIFDLTENTDDDTPLIDLTETSGGLSLADDDPLDLTAPADTGDSDLLDVTKTGDISDAGTDDLLNVTTPGSLTDVNVDSEENTVDFDISETVADVFSNTTDETSSSDDLLDIDDEEEALDFDIGSLDDVADTAANDEYQTVKLGAADDGATSDDDTVDFDLSLQSTELDELTETTDDAPEEDAAIDFDLALEDTSDMDSIVVDETLELPKATTEDESLEDLTKSMEESMAELELDMDTSDSELEASLDGEMDIDLDIGGDDTVGIEAGSDIADDGDFEDVEQTVVLTEGASGDASETDTKLNLAKAYIELGDNEGARSILDEVSRDGTEEQKIEAQRLIDQIS
ncbi:MAG: FimV/HubP family polar landmark protein [Gammaproteobacteria bacterium]